MKKFFRILTILLAIALVAASVFLFFEVERQNKKLNDVKLSAEITYSQWEMQNNCIEDPLPCDSSTYSKQFKTWLSQFDQYREHREQNPKFQGYLFLKELDELYIPEQNSGGKASLAVGCAFVLLFSFLIFYLMGGQKTAKASRVEMKGERTTRKSESASRQTASISSKPDIQALLRKATGCAESEPAQAISYLEQAIEGSLGTKLSPPTLLLCGSLRLKNKIGEKQGKEQLQRIISAWPQSAEAKKAQIVLNTFK